MVLKSRKKAYSSVHESVSIITFPTEILLITFSHLDISALLCLSNVCKRFQFIGERCITEKFKEPNVALSLSFEQEHKWNYGVNFFFDHWDSDNGRFVFKPRLPERMKFIHSSMIKKPTIYKIQITRVNDRSNVDTSITTGTTATNNTTTIQNNNAPTTTITITTQKHQKLPDNFIQNSCAFSIKKTNATVEKIMKVYRIGHGSNHLITSFRFIYTVTDKPPPSENASRGGERWIIPKAFECYTSFFYPHEPTAHKIMMSIMQLKKNGKSQKDIHKNLIKQDIKGKNVVRSDNLINRGENADRTDDFIIINKAERKGKNVVRFEDPQMNSLEIEVDMDGQEISLQDDSMNNINFSYLQGIQEQQANMITIRKLINPIKSSTRWVRGARR